MSTPRVLLVEDDASIRRFVALAFEGMDVELHEAATLAEARQRLGQQGPYRLVLLDLMLPDGSGESLLQHLHDEPPLRAGARIAVFSAGLPGTTAQRLLSLGADEIIGKPAPLAQLLTALDSALAAAPAEDSTASAVATYFNGDRKLFELYRASCRAQFALDRRAGDQHLAQRDSAALRRLAHSLKTVLLTLGHDADSATARQLERDAEAGNEPAMRLGWSRLATALDRLAQPPEGA